MTIEDKLALLEKKQDEVLAILKDLHKSGGMTCKDQVYDFTDLAEMLHVSPRTLHKWKSAGLMRFTQVGKKMYLTDAELKRFLEIHKNN